MQISEVVYGAIQKAGKQESLAIILDLAPSALSKRINGEIGWHEHDIDRLLVFSGLKIVSITESEGKIKTLKEALKIMMEDDVEAK